MPRDRPRQRGQWEKKESGTRLQRRRSEGGGGGEQGGPAEEGGGGAVDRGRGAEMIGGVAGLAGDGAHHQGTQVLRRAHPARGAGKVLAEDRRRGVEEQVEKDAERDELRHRQQAPARAVAAPEVRRRREPGPRRDTGEHARAQ